MARLTPTLAFWLALTAPLTATAADCYLPPEPVCRDDSAYCQGEWRAYRDSISRYRWCRQDEERAERSAPKAAPKDNPWDTP